MSTDRKQEIIEYLTTLRQKSYAENEPFKVRAYSKAIQQISAVPTITSVDDIKDLAGVGKKIQLKVAEILETGHLKEANDAAESLSLPAYNALQEVHGIGPAKARDLIDKHEVRTLDDLKKAVTANPDLLTTAQKIGLHYLDDLKKRIPRAEMEKHEAYVRSMLPKDFDMAIVGSYRRGAVTSGDIDIMVTSRTLSELVAASHFQEVVDLLEDDGYLKATFARGEHKFMGVSRLPHHRVHRHIDLLLCKPEEYWYTILYFTGSDVFNVSMRRLCLEKGYSLSEHGLKVKREGVPAPPIMKSEKDIFDFLQIPYVRPEDRGTPLS